MPDSLRSVQARPRKPESSNIDEQRLINALEANIVEADTIQGSEISEQRQRNHVFYAMDRLGNEERNRSHHISGDVLDSVESQKSYYLQSFYSGRSVVEFEPEDDKDLTSHLATEYVDQVYNDENKGYMFTRDALHDAFVAKRCVAFVDWEDDDEEVEEKLPPLPANQIAAMEQTGKMQVIDRQPVPGPQGILVQATIRRLEDTSKVLVELIQPERYYRDPNVAYIDEAAFAGWQEDLPRYELVDRGFDPEEVKELNLDYRFRQNEEDAARKAHDSTWSRARRHKRPQEMEIVTIYTTYAYVDLQNYSAAEPDVHVDGVRLYKFVWSQGKLLTLPDREENEDPRWEEILDGMPFIEWTQLKISHSEHGLCEADVQSDIQWSKSNLMRLIINNQAMVNSTRYKAKHGMIKNPRELLDNNIGSTLWMKDPERDLIAMPTVPLSPVSFQVIEELNTEKENRTGQSRLSKGLNADAVSKQNADDMIERLTNASNRRTMMGVRSFAEEFLKQIFLRIYNLGVKYDEKPRIANVGGKFIEMNPGQWPKRTKCKVRVALTPEQAEQEAMFLVNLDTKLSQDPKMTPLYGLEQRHALYDDVCDLMGVGDTSRYMKQPDDPQVIQEIQQGMKQAESMQKMQEQAIGLQTANQQLTMKLDMQKDQREDMLARIKALEGQAKIRDMADDNVREDRRLDKDILESAAEYELEKEQKRPVQLD